MIYAFQLYLIVCVLFLAGKDSDSYQLKDKKDGPLTAGRVRRWHRDGFILYLLFAVPLVGWLPMLWWKIAIIWVMIRAIFFDLPFNAWSNLPVTYLGGTAWTDRLMVKIFGMNGAILKTSIFLALLVGFNIANYFLL